jgi:hypothetical protein
MFAAGFFVGANYERRNSENILRIQGTDWLWEFRHPKDHKSSLFKALQNEKSLDNTNRQKESDWRNQ